MNTTSHELEHLCVTGDQLSPLLWASDRELSLDQVRAPSNVSWNKPDGGLWLSPQMGDRSIWIEFLERESWSPYKEARLTTQTVEVKPTARFLQIDSYTDFAQILSAYLYIPSDNDFISLLGPFSQVFDFEKIAEEWDGIYMTEEGQASTRFGPTASSASLYGWDLEQVLIFDAATVTKVSPPTPYELALGRVNWEYPDED